MFLFHFENVQYAKMENHYSLELLSYRNGLEFTLLREKIKLAGLLEKETK